MKMQVKLPNNIILMCAFQLCLFGLASASRRGEAGSIADQLGFGMRRNVHYLGTLLEKCDNVDDFKQWIFFMNSYLKCDEEAHPKKRISLHEESSLGRLSVLCSAWPRKRKCSSRLASKLDSCLGLQQEDGRAGANALRLTDAHMKFICRHKHEYSNNLEKSDEILPIEKRPLACFREMEAPLAKCIAEGNLMVPQTTFCEKFNLAKNCLVTTSMELCKNHSAQKFLHSMLKQIQLDVRCPGK